PDVIASMSCPLWQGSEVRGVINSNSRQGDKPGSKGCQLVVMWVVVCSVSWPQARDRAVACEQDRPGLFAEVGEEKMLKESRKGCGTCLFPGAETDRKTDGRQPITVTGGARPRRVARAGRTILRASPGGPRSGSHQGRAPRPGRRHARLGAALARLAQRVLPLLQPQQERDRTRPGAAGGDRGLSWPGRPERYPAGELSRRQRGETWPRPGSAARNQPAADRLLDLRFRANRPVARSPRLRLCGSGPERLDEHYRAGGGAAVQGRRGGYRRADRAVCRGRRAGPSSRPPPPPPPLPPP